MQKNSTELKIREVIVVEGRDDTARVKEAVLADTFETGGFGYGEDRLKKLDKFYQTRGLIIFTDPDHAGRKIRQDLKARYPLAKEAFVSVKESKAKGDLGIENVSLDRIRQAIEKTKPTYIAIRQRYSKMDMISYGLTASPDSKARRQYLADLLGIEMGNGNFFLEQLNSNNIDKNRLEEELDKYDRS